MMFWAREGPTPLKATQKLLLAGHLQGLDQALLHPLDQSHKPEVCTCLLCLNTVSHLYAAN